MEEWFEDSYGCEGEGRSGHRVLRGGSFDEGGADIVMACVRGNAAPDDRWGTHGFRCVVVVSAP